MLPTAAKLSFKETIMTNDLSTQAAPRTSGASPAPTIDHSVESDRGALEFLEANQQSPGE
jgi:hypothetical protein